MAGEDYVYIPIGADQIRILHFNQVADLTVPIECYMQIKDLEPDDGRYHWGSGPAYEALSYAWGKTYEDGSHLTDYILCEGKKLPVTAHLLRGLRRVQEIQLSGIGSRSWMDQKDLIGYERVGARYPLWVDSICINQRDDIEKSQQVRMMGRVYSQAERVQVWLGEPSTQSARVMHEICRQHMPDPSVINHAGQNFATLFGKKLQKPVYVPLNQSKSIEQNLQASNQSNVDMSSVNQEAVQSLIQSGIQNLAQSLSQSLVQAFQQQSSIRASDTVQSGQIAMKGVLEELLQNPYFGRRWIIQELSLASNHLFIYGNSAIDSETMTTLIHNFSLTEPFSWRTTKFNAKQKRSGLLSNLYFYDSAECFNERDRVYALRDISKDGNIVTVDYSSSVSSVFTEVAKVFANKENLITLLTLATAKPSSFGTEAQSAQKSNVEEVPSVTKTYEEWLPSWVPSWSSPLTYSAKEHSSSVHHFMSQPSSTTFDYNGPIWISPASCLRLQGWLLTRCAHTRSSRWCMYCRLFGRDGASSKFRWALGVRDRDQNILQELLNLEAGSTFCVLDGSDMVFVLEAKDETSFKLRMCFMINFKDFAPLLRGKTGSFFAPAALAQQEFYVS